MSERSIDGLEPVKEQGKRNALGKAWEGEEYSFSSPAIRIGLVAQDSCPVSEVESLTVLVTLQQSIILDIIHRMDRGKMRCCKSILLCGLCRSEVEGCRIFTTIVKSI